MGWFRRRDPRPRRQVLSLTGVQLMSWALEADELVLDLFGGDGTWDGYRGGVLAQRGHVTAPPMFTVRAATASGLDLDLLERLDRWTDTGAALDVRLEGPGWSGLDEPCRVRLSDGQASLSVVERTSIR